MDKENISVKLNVECSDIDSAVTKAKVWWNY